MATPAPAGGERVPGRAAKPGVGLAGGLAGDAGLRRATSQSEGGVSDPRGPGFAVFSRGGLVTTRVGAVRLPLLRSRPAGAVGWGRSPKEEGRARQRCAPTPHPQNGTPPPGPDAHAAPAPAQPPSKPPAPSQSDTACGTGTPTAG